MSSSDFSSREPEPCDPVQTSDAEDHFTAEDSRDAIAIGLIAGLRSGREPDGSVDLSNARLIGADLSGLNLALADLSGADLSRANLSDTILLKADLEGATLFEADLTRAELSGANLCGANLEGANLTYAGLGCASLRRAKLVRADLLGATLTEADLFEADLRVANLEGVRAHETNFTRTDLSKGRLKGIQLDRSSVDYATFDGTDLRGASLAGLRGYKQAHWIGVDLRDIDFTGAYLCRSFIMDQNFIEEFRTQSSWSGALYHLWRLTSDCGRSVTRWAFCTILIVCAFAWLYTIVGIDYGQYQTPLSPLYYSVVTLTTLGYGDVLPSTTGGQAAAMLEVVMGYVMLGGLLSIFSNKMASRAD